MELMTFVSQSSSSDETIYGIQEDKNFETYLLIWVDASINSEENIDAQKKVRSSINYLKTFDKLDECKKYILSISSEDRIILIINGHFGQQLIPEIHGLRQISSIHIYCTNKEFHQQWSKQYNKIKSVHNQLNELIIQIESDQSSRRSYEADEPLSISILDSDTNNEQSTTGFDGRFVQSQLLISCLLKMSSTSEDKNQFISRFRQIYETNSSYLKFVNTFEKDYVSEDALLWYTKEGFIYDSLNKALRTQDIDLLFCFAFYIRDIEKQLEQLHKEQCQEDIRVYRGQYMSTEELNILKNSKDKFISMNSFLSTSSNLEVALSYAIPFEIDQN